MAKKSGPPKGVLTSRDFLRKIKNETDTIRLAVMYGDEPFFIDSCLSILKTKLISPDAEDMDMKVFDCRSADRFSFEMLDEQLSMPPWMSKRKLIVIRSSGILDSDITDEHLKILADIPDYCFVFIAEEKGNATRKAFRRIAEIGVVGQCMKLDEKELADWIDSLFAKSGIKIDREAAVSLASRCDCTMMVIYNEVIKLTLYAREENLHIIDADTIEQCCPPDLSGKVFTIMDACGTGNAGQALYTLDNLILTRQPVILIRVTLMNHLKRMICAKELGDPSAVSQRLGCADFVARKLVNQTNRFTLEHLIDLYLLSVNNDSAVKHGLADERISLECLIIKASEKQ